MLKGFKEFILRGNVVDLAVGVVIGAAFNSVVSSLVKDLLTPFISAIVKQPNFESLTFTINHSQFLYGDLLNNLISFLLVAGAVYFFVVLPLHSFFNRMHKNPPLTTKKCPECLSDIPVGAKRCAFCTSLQPEDKK